MSWRSTAVGAAMEKVHPQSPEVVYTRHRVVRIMHFPPAFAALSFSPDWTRSFIDRWEGSHDGRLCNLSFVSPRVRAWRKKTCERKNKGRKEPALRTARRRERLFLFVPFPTSSSPLSISPPLLILSSFPVSIFLVLLVSRETCGGGVSGVNV